MNASRLVMAILPVVLLHIDGSWAFTSPSKLKGVSCTKVTTSFDRLTTSAGAAKKRRRKKSSPSSSSSKVPSPNELPDFDLDDDYEPKENSGSVNSVNPDEISANMMGSPNKPTRTIDELISDRSLEKNFEFDESGDESLPDLAVMAQQQSDDGSEMGRKRSKQEARKAAAIARKAEEEQNANPLENIPFILDEKGEVSATKILEAGTWLGIALLVLWEIYINSPFFDRQGPMAPFIYDIYL